MAEVTTSSSTTDVIDPAAFTRIEQSEKIHGISRPSLSYWQDAWIRLKANKRAVYALYLVIGLLLFTFLGPLVWTVDPAAQDVEQISHRSLTSPSFPDEYTKLLP